MKAENLRSCNNRVRASVYPTNRIILTEHGIRQVAFPYYYLYNKMIYKNLSVFKKYQVMASVYPTHHNKIWLSSGHVPQYKLRGSDSI